jgi:uncharacterized membrane protein YfcA
LSDLARTVVLFPVALCAGTLGSLIGLGGGVLLVPILILVFHIATRYALGASLVSVIATSCGSASSYVRDRISSVPIAVMLEIATTVGALTGAVLMGHLDPRVLEVLFGLALLAATFSMVRHQEGELPENVRPHPVAHWLGLHGRYHDARLGRDVDYQVAGVPGGFGMMYLAGVLSGLLGIGSGTFKVIALDGFMRLPFKVSTATSNFMMGVTAAASAGYYFAHGLVNPGITAPVALGVFIGASLGALIMVRLRSRTLRWVFVPALVFAAGEMLLKGLGVTAV